MSFPRRRAECPYSALQGESSVVEIKGDMKIMFNKEENTNWQQFHDLTEIMENTPPKQVPDNFTSKLMAKLLEGKEIVQSLSFKTLFPTFLNFGFRNALTKTDCAFYYFLTGFFYFIMGLIMMIGFPLPSIMQNNSWLSFQPFFGILIAAELTIIGIYLYKKGESAVRIVRIGTLLYAVMIILDLGIGTLYIKTMTAVFFISVFSLTGLALALLLKMAIDHYHPETMLSEVRG